MVSTSINRVLVALLLLLAVACVGLGRFALQEGRRADRAEKHIQAVAPSTVIATPATSKRTYRANNGVVLKGDDLDRLDAQRRQIDRHVAELEYSLLGPRSERARPRPAQSK